MINKEKQVKYVDRLEALFKQNSETIDAIEKVFGDVGDSNLFGSVWDTYTIAIDTTAELIGVTSEALCWHIFDNEFGKGESVCELEGEKYCIHDNTSFIEYENLAKNIKEGQ